MTHGPAPATAGALATPDPAKDAAEAQVAAFVKRVGGYIDRLKEAVAAAQKGKQGLAAAGGGGGEGPQQRANEQSVAHMTGVVGARVRASGAWRGVGMCDVGHGRWVLGAWWVEGRAVGAVLHCVGRPPCTVGVCRTAPLRLSVRFCCTRSAGARRARLGGAAVGAHRPAAPAHRLSRPRHAPPSLTPSPAPACASTHVPTTVLRSCCSYCSYCSCSCRRF